MSVYLKNQSLNTSNIHFPLTLCHSFIAKFSACVCVFITQYVIDVDLVSLWLWVTPVSVVSMRVSECASACSTCEHPPPFIRISYSQYSCPKTHAASSLSNMSFSLTYLCSHSLLLCPVSPSISGHIILQHPQPLSLTLTQRRETTHAHTHAHNKRLWQGCVWSVIWCRSFLPCSTFGVSIMS